MKKKSFKEFLAKKDKKSELVPDQGKGSVPYKCPISPEKPKKAEIGLVDKGDEKLKINHKQPTTSELKPVKKNSKFSQYVTENCGCGISSDELPKVTAYTSGGFHPHPPEAIKYVAVLGKKNDSILSDLVEELKNNNLLEALLKKLLSDEAGYDALTRFFGDEEEGENRSSLFAKQMDKSYQDFLTSQKNMWDESVSPPIGFDSDDEDDDEGFDSDDDNDDEGFDSDDEDDDEGFDSDDEDDDEGFDSDDEDDDEGFDSNDEDDDEGFDSNDEDDDEGFDSNDEDDLSSKYKKHFDDLENDNEKEFTKSNRKLKKKFAHHNILKSMSGYDHMFGNN